MDKECPDWVPEHFRPSDRQKSDWWRFVMPEDGADEHGWWLGWCPLHDKTRDVDQATACFNFDRDSFRCDAAPPCHAGKRGMSLSNLKVAMGG